MKASRLPRRTQNAPEGTAWNHWVVKVLVGAIIGAAVSWVSATAAKDTTHDVGLAVAKTQIESIEKTLTSQQSQLNRIETKIDAHMLRDTDSKKEK